MAYLLEPKQLQKVPANSFGYVGVLWMSDLVWRDGRWQANHEHIPENGHKSHLLAARKPPRHTTAGSTFKEDQPYTRPVLSPLDLGLTSPIPPVNQGHKIHFIPYILFI